MTPWTDTGTLAGTLVDVGPTPVRGPWCYTCPNVDNWPDVPSDCSVLYPARVTYAVATGDVDGWYAEPPGVSD